MIRASLLALAALLAACGAAETTLPTDAPGESERATVDFPAELADAAGLALGAWRRAGYDTPDPVIGASNATWRLLLVDGLIHDCGTEPGTAAIGCTERPMWPGDATLVFISRETPPHQLETVVAHEIGHALDLDHTSDGGVMDPNRDLGAAL